jgi:hypothetical protein
MSVEFGVEIRRLLRAVSLADEHFQEVHVGLFEILLEQFLHDVRMKRLDLCSAARPVRASHIVLAIAAPMGKLSGRKLIQHGEASLAHG